MTLFFVGEETDILHYELFLLKDATDRLKGIHTLRLPRNIQICAITYGENFRTVLNTDDRVTSA